MSRPAHVAGFVPVGFFALTTVLAAATVVGGWAGMEPQPAAGYGIVAHSVERHPLPAPSGYGVDEIEVR